MNKKKKFWITATILGVLSSIIIILTYFKQPEDINYAGSRFAHNLTFFYPLFFLSIILGIISFVYFVKYLRTKELKPERFKFIKIIIPIVFLLPIFIQFIYVSIFLIYVSIPTQYPGLEDAKFTSYKINIESTNNTLYLHGGMYGELFNERTVYLTDKTLPEIKGNESNLLKYEGKWREFFLFYKNVGDTLKIYIPYGQKKDTSLFHTPVLLQQIECADKEVSTLRELYNERKLKQFGFRHD